MCVLQSLLTQCIELLKYMESEPIQREFFDQVINDGPNLWGRNTSIIVENTFPEDVTLKRLLEHLRNAVSHPSPDTEFRYQPTGYNGWPLSAHRGGSVHRFAVGKGWRASLPRIAPAPHRKGRNRQDHGVSP